MPEPRGLPEGSDCSPDRAVAALILRQIEPFKPVLVQGEQTNPVFGELLHPADGRLGERLGDHYRKAGYRDNQQSLGTHLSNNAVTQDDIANALNVDRTTVSKWLSGRSTIPYDKYLHFETIFQDEFTTWVRPTARQRAASGYIAAASFLNREVTRSSPNLSVPASLSCEEFWYLFHAHKRAGPSLLSSHCNGQSVHGLDFVDLAHNVALDFNKSIAPRTATWFSDVNSAWGIWFRVSLLCVTSSLGREATSTVLTDEASSTTLKEYEGNRNG